MGVKMNQKYLINDVYVGKERTTSLVYTFKLNGVSTNISSWDFYFTAKSLLTDTDANAKIKKEPIDCIKTASIPLGTVDTVSINLDSADTNITEGSYFFDVVYKDGSNITTVHRANLVIEPQVTQRA